MKKYFVLSVVLIISASVFAQIKHNKFATRIKFDQFNMSDFWQTEVTEIKDNSGYFLSNRKDGSGFNPSLVKLDVDGNKVFDTIYDLSQAGNRRSVARQGACGRRHNRRRRGCSLCQVRQAGDDAGDGRLPGA